MDNFLEISGILFWVLIFVLTLYIIVYGKNWLIKFGLHVLSLKKFNQAIENLSSELPNEVRRETVSKVIGTLVWRLTRIGLLAVIITSIPLILLYQQNQLIKSQNTLFLEQNGMIEIQSNLLNDQNKLIKNQLRPYIDISTPFDNNSITLLNIYNAPAFVDSMIIEYYVKDFGSNPFVLIDRQVESGFTLYPTTNQTLRRIQTNILTDDFIKDLKDNNRRLMRKTKILYSNLKDEVSGKDILGKFKSERVDFLSKKNNRWYLKKED